MRDLLSLLFFIAILCWAYSSITDWLAEKKETRTYQDKLIKLNFHQSDIKIITDQLKPIEEILNVSNDQVEEIGRHLNVAIKSIDTPNVSPPASIASTHTNLLLSLFS
jgi:hypothetical protein